MRTVYVSDSLRTHFISTHASRMAVKMGFNLQGDKYSLLSVISMLVFPQLAQGALGPALGLEYNESFAKEYGTHVAGLMNHKKVQESA